MFDQAELRSFLFGNIFKCTNTYSAPSTLSLDRQWITEFNNFEVAILGAQTIGNRQVRITHRSWYHQQQILKKNNSPTQAYRLVKDASLCYHNNLCQKLRMRQDDIITCVKWKSNKGNAVAHTLARLVASTYWMPIYSAPQQVKHERHCKIWE